jgi:cytochrome b pre-mRNA-processing protein 3
MLDWLTRRSAVKRKALELYGGVVTAARNPWFYGPGRVEDTPESRFELVALHLFLVAERAKEQQPDGDALAQGLIEALVTDMDDCLREMGVGDLTVPKRVKRAAAVFYERGGAYRQALADGAASGGTDLLKDLLTRTLLSIDAEPAFAAALAAYVRASHDRLSIQDLASTRQLDFAALPDKVEKST